MDVMLVGTGTVEFGALDTAKRTITGLLVEWGRVAMSRGRRWRFAPNSLYWSQASRIKLNLGHERQETIGAATALWESPRGLHGSFKVARVPEGDRALELAASGVWDGLSIEVGFDEAGTDDFGEDPADGSVTLVRRGGLMGVALTPNPAFDNARVESVAASRDSRLELRLTDAEVADVQAAAADAGVSMSELVRTQLRAYTRQRPVYALDASGATPSLVCDVWHSLNEGRLGDASDARQRLKEHERFMRTVRAEFATVTTTTAAAVVPAGYEPLVADSTADRPLFAAASRGGLSDATPFLVPGNLSEASVESSADVVAEGVQATEGSAAFSGGTVTPTGIKGRHTVTRELVDASNPGVDQILLAAMREDFNRQAEKAIFAELNAVQAGTITAGLVPSGAMARTSTGAALPADLRKAILAFVEVRKTKARNVVASSRTAVAEALETLDLAAFALRDVTVELSPWITGVAAGDGDVFVTASGDLWAWSSPLLSFEFMEKLGPHLVELGIFGYFATKTIKPAGLASIRHT